jgi:hypothetical protein
MNLTKVYKGCKNGSQCTFHLANKCIYSHVPCKYGDKCLYKENCYFFHEKEQLTISKPISKPETKSLPKKESEYIEKERCPSCKQIFKVNEVRYGENKKCYECYEHYDIYGGQFEDYEPRDNW